MAIFNVNGNETDSITEAMEFCRQVWIEYKRPAVIEQHKAALSKPNDLDRQRAAYGVTHDDIVAAGTPFVNIPAAKGAST